MNVWRQLITQIVTGILIQPLPHGPLPYIPPKYHVGSSPFVPLDLLHPAVCPRRLLCDCLTWAPSLQAFSWIWPVGGTYRRCEGRRRQKGVVKPPSPSPAAALTPCFSTWVLIRGWGPHQVPMMSHCPWPSGLPTVASSWVLPMSGLGL